MNRQNAKAQRNRLFIVKPYHLIDQNLVDHSFSSYFSASRIDNYYNAISTVGFSSIIAWVFHVAITTCYNNMAVAL